MIEKIGFFGGTFDPIHFGHLNLLVELKERCFLDRIFICPAHVSPTKEDKPALAKGEHRLKMLQLLTSELPGVEVTDIELSRPPPSYTIETIQRLFKREGEGKKFYLLTAEDTAYTMGSWKEIEKLLAFASPIVGTRHGFDSRRLESLPLAVKTKLERGRIQISAMDITSTRVRERLKKKLYCSHLIPAKVLDYIYENRLY